MNTQLSTEALRQIIAYNRDNDEMHERLVYAEKTLVAFYSTIQAALPGFSSENAKASSSPCLILKNALLIFTSILLRSRQKGSSCHWLKQASG